MSATLEKHLMDELGLTNVAARKLALQARRKLGQSKGPLNYHELQRLEDECFKLHKTQKVFQVENPERHSELSLKLQQVCNERLAIESRMHEAERKRMEERRRKHEREQDEIKYQKQKEDDKRFLPLDERRDEPPKTVVDKKTKPIESPYKYLPPKPKHRPTKAPVSPTTHTKLMVPKQKFPTYIPSLVVCHAPHFHDDETVQTHSTEGSSRSLTGDDSEHSVKVVKIGDKNLLEC